MKKPENVYRKNFLLIISFLVLISITFIIALIVSYNLTANYVENEFTSKKIDVLEQTIKPYNNLFQNKIPEITSYQGFLDSASAARYASVVFHDYPFVTRMVFFDMRISNKKSSTVIKNNLGISVNAIYQYQLKNGKTTGLKLSLKTSEPDFMKMALKLSNYITFSDTSGGTTQNEIFKTFYDVKPSFAARSRSSASPRPTR